MRVRRRCQEFTLCGPAESANLRTALPDQNQTAVADVLAQDGEIVAIVKLILFHFDVILARITRLRD